MSLSVQPVQQAHQAGLVQTAKGAALGPAAAPAPAQFGSAPAASLSISAQAKVAQAKALAIKNGHDPDGIQDGK